MRHLFRRGSAALAVLMLGACNFAPEYTHPPEMPVPDAYKEISSDQWGSWRMAEPADGVPRGNWWAVFNDKGLDALEAQATGANQDIKAAVARLDQARGAAAVARAAYFPSVNGSADATREQVSKTVANARPATLFNDFSIGATLSYEVDLWGRVRNTADAAKAQAQASEADLATVDLSTHAELATDYFTLRGDDTRQKTLDEAVAAYTEALRLTLDRFHGGAAVEADVDQAQTQLETAKTLAADMRLQRAQLEHAIAILVGTPASQFSLPAAPLDAQPPQIAVDLPASLLQRRPDVAEAERQVFAANAQIGVARAAYFPVISLNAVLGVESAGTSKLFSLPSRFWSLGPSATLPLFDAGSRDALTDEAKAVYDQNAANYRQTVLGAYRDVEDNIVALNRLAEEATTQGKAVQAARRALQQAQYRYTGGIVTYLEVVTAENTALQAELTESDIATRRMNAGVLLVKALGGGWQNCLDEKPS